MGGVWVFPGGAVDAGEDEVDAALRELHEEAAIDGIDRDALVRFSQWITPAEVKIRFDTHFFLAPAPPGQEIVALTRQEIVRLSEHDLQPVTFELHVPYDLGLKQADGVAGG